ncbi:MAG: MBL fold metallo-hydrolase [Planctomycetota bacterium]
MGITLAGHEVEAFSVAGFQTCIELPQHSVAFDIGFCPRSAINRSTVLVSHTHMDHVASIAHHAATRGMLGMKPATYVIPSVNRAAVEDLFAAHAKLDGCEHERVLRPADPGDSIPIARDIEARPFFSPHRVPCQGYALWRKFTKLKPELVGRTSDEIGRLRREGHDVSVATEVAEVAYTGDTKIEVVEREEVVRKARLLIMEVTFVANDVDIEGARARGHIHLDEVARRADLFENEAILFLHFSARYSQEQILRALDTKLPAKLRERVTPLLGGHA